MSMILGDTNIQTHKDAEPHSFAREACWRVLPSHANRSSTSGGRRAPVRPIQRSRGAVRKVIAMHRGTSGICGREISSEPGIDPRRATAEAQLLGLVAERGAHDEPRVRGPAGEAASEREPWVKVRWINISGISWDVIKAVSLCYDLHPLALEDILRQRSGNRSKADYYSLSGYYAMSLAARTTLSTP